MIENLSRKHLEIISKNFLEEIKKSYRGEKTSLHFIIHELSASPLVKENENFQAMAVGGSVFKKALLKKTKNGIQIVKIENEKNIYFENENDFLKFICEELYPKIKALALNFAYPLKPVFENGKLDGTLLAVTKEGGFHGLIGKRIGKEIENYALAKRNRKIKAAIANDTVCLLTSGLSSFKQQELAAGIVGTGFNIAFFLDKNRLVNLESANFDKFPRTKTGMKVDKESSHPGRSLFEKEIAGAYLYKHFNLITKEKNLLFPTIKSTEELNNISFKNIPAISAIAKDLIRRSAQLVACQIAGILLFKKQNMIFVMEGSLFWKGNLYKKTVEKTVRELVPEHKANFVEIKNSAILGAAKLIG